MLIIEHVRHVTPRPSLLIWGVYIVPMIVVHFGHPVSILFQPLESVQNIHIIFRLSDILKHDVCIRTRSYNHVIKAVLMDDKWRELFSISEYFYPQCPFASFQLLMFIGNWSLSLGRGINIRRKSISVIRLSTRSFHQGNGIVPLWA